MKLLCSIITVLSFAVCALSQSNTGKLSGTVFASDGVLPGAIVRIKDNRTGIEKTVTTDRSGNYSLPQLEVGTYTVKVSANKFKGSEFTNVVINVGQEHTLNIVLEIGNVEETVTVTIGEDLLNTSSPELSRTVSGRQIRELPLNGRNPLSLTALQTGVANNLAQLTVINGIRTSATNIVQDGINIQDNYIRANATDFSPARPSVDNVEEYTISTQAGPDRGFGGPQIDLVTLRGGNQFTGAMFIYNRNSQFAANNFFNNSLGTYGQNSFESLSGQRRAGEAIAPRPALNRNQFGGRIAGPIIKDKMFFFAFYEGLRLTQEVSQNNVVLTDDARLGRFFYVDDSPLKLIQSRQLFGAGRLIVLPPANNPNSPVPVEINPFVQSRILAMMPRGNFASVGDNLNTIGYRFNRSVPQHRNQFTGRIDYQINAINSVNGVVDLNREAAARNDADTSLNARPSIELLGKATRVAVGYRRAFSDALVNEIRGGIFFNKPEFVRNGETPTDNYFPTLITNLANTFQPEGRTARTFNLQDTVDYLRGNHNFRFGGQFQRVTVSTYSFGGLIPNYNFGVGLNTPQILQSTFNNSNEFPGGINSAQRTVANNLYALLGGIINTASQRFNATSPDSGFVQGARAERELNYNAYAAYLNDQWKITPELTLNLGVRYDLYSGVKAGNGLYFEPVITNPKNIAADLLNPQGRFQPVGGNAGGNNRFFKTDKDNFSPVVGFAYAPNFKGRLSRLLLGGAGKTVLRGGFRFSYINDEYVRAPEAVANGNGGYSLTNFATFRNSAGVVSNSIDNRFGGSLTGVETPPFSANRNFADNNTLELGGFGTVFAIDPNLEMPRVMEYSLGIQRELPGQIGLEIRYVGTRSNNLVRGIDYNQIDIRRNGFTEDFNRARANLLLTGNPACTSSGCQTLTVFPQLASGGLLNNPTVRGQLLDGTTADLAFLYLRNGLAGNVQFLPNPSTGTAGLLYNGGFSRYDSLQMEVRRRFVNGFDFQANYTFSKSLTNAVGTAQERFEPFLDLENQILEISRADYDQTHVFNFNGNYDLPFGEGKRFFNQGGWLNQLVGGFQITGIVRWASGAPITFIDPNGTLNRAGRSARQTAVTNLSKDDLKDLMGIYRTPNGVFFINPAVVGRNPDGSKRAGATGRAANGFFSVPFEGQVFFNNAPGTTSGLERAVVNGPTYLNVDTSIVKNFHFSERRRIILRMDVFNVFNRANFFVGQFQNINSPSFGLVTSTTQPRIIQFAARTEF